MSDRALAALPRLRPALRRAGQAARSCRRCCACSTGIPTSRSSSITARSPRSPPEAGSPGRAGIAALARHPRAHVQAVGARDRSRRRLDRRRRCARYVDHLLACFGPQRLMWGSDWPVVDLAGGYRRWVAATEALLARARRRRPRRDPAAATRGGFYGLLTRLPATRAASVDVPPQLGAVRDRRRDFLDRLRRRVEHRDAFALASGAPPRAPRSGSSRAPRTCCPGGALRGSRAGARD